MALFPAYAEKDALNLDEENEENGQCNVPVELESSLLESPDDVNDDGSSQTSSIGDGSINSSISTTESSVKRKKKSSKKKKKKSRKGRDSDEEKSNNEKYKYHNVIDYKSDYYEDHKYEYGNLKVSTLYNPARPQYDYTNVILGSVIFDRKAISKKPILRYFSRNLNFDYNSDDDANSKAAKKKTTKPKTTTEYIDITDSGIAWSDSRIEEDLIEKTAQFNKSLNTNPYDVDLWLKYVKLQEDRMLFDIYNKRCTESTARSTCYAKQLSILHKALETNYNSVELLSKQVEISELSLPNEQYLSSLKGIVTMPGLNSVLLSRAWFWYVEAVQCSMALCSVSSVKEMYEAGVKAMMKTQGSGYQKSHVELTYRFGLFLRQAGLWEQLWMLVKMNLELNIHTKQCLSDVFDSIVPPVDETSLADNESVIMSSGLPTQTVWCRVETLRSHHHWFPAEFDDDDNNAIIDPQRQVFSSDVAHFIVPITPLQHQFALVVNILRLLKVPLLPLKHSTLCALGQGDIPIGWEYDCIESCLPCLYAILGSVNAGSRDPVHCKLIANIIKDFSEQPNFLDVNSNYYKAVSSLMIESSNWFSGKERTALLIWFIRLQRIILFTLRWKDIGEQKNAYNKVRKSIKDLLKSYPEDVLLFCEFAAFEGQILGLQRGLKVLETSLRCLPSEKAVARTYSIRCFVQMILADSGNTTSAVNSLIALALCKPLPADLTSDPSDEDIQQALEKFTEGTDVILLSLSENCSEISLVEHLLPEVSAEWLCCHAWFVYLSQSPVTFMGFYNKIRAATHVSKDESAGLESKRKLWLRENVLECVVMAAFSKLLFKDETCRDNVTFQESLFKEMLEEFPQNATISWRCAEVWGTSGPVGRWRIMGGLRKCDKSSALLALSFLFQNFEHLYRKEVPFYEDSWQPGHSNRLVNLLSGICTHPQLRRHSLLWKMWLVFVSQHSSSFSSNTIKGILYRALDECPWDKGLYALGCAHLPGQFGELLDIMVEKQIRLHTMPEELSPI